MLKFLYIAGAINTAVSIWSAVSYASSRHDFDDIIPGLLMLATAGLGLVLTCLGAFQIYCREKRLWVAAATLVCAAPLAVLLLHSRLERITAEDLAVARNLALVAGVVGTLVWLNVALCREWVKGDLRSRFCQPLSIRWRFFGSSHAGCAFRVHYSDNRGYIHRAICWTLWYRRGVRWGRDELIDEETANESYARAGSPSSRVIMR